ncbi:ExbD/TolR family protein [Erythrobacter litoralis]|nr:hypothetical protein [Erythrobacter litoralis]
MPRKLRPRTPRRRFDHGAPIARPSLAPLAAVWLIAAALCMGAYVNPPHALLVGLPAPLPRDTIGVLTPSYDLLDLDAEGTIRWNGHPVTEEQLRAILSESGQRSPQGALLFHPQHDVAYGDALGLLAIVHREGAIDGCFRFSEIQRFADYENPPDFERLVAPDYRECDLWFE